MKHWRHYIENPLIIFEGLTIKLFGRFLPDKMFIKLLYKYVTGRKKT